MTSVSRVYNAATFLLILILIVSGLQESVLVHPERQFFSLKEGVTDFSLNFYVTFTQNLDKTKHI